MMHPLADILERLRAQQFQASAQGGAVPSGVDVGSGRLSLGTEQRVNNAAGSRHGQAFQDVVGSNGLHGHLYGNGETVWLPSKGQSPGASSAQAAQPSLKDLLAALRAEPPHLTRQHRQGM